MGNSSYKLLIVSGSAEANEMKLRLAESDFTSVSIANYPEAIVALRAAVPDLVLVTKQHGQSSLSVINKIHRQFPMLPIVMVATDMEETMREHLGAGASDYLYYVEAEKELLAFVVRQNLESRINAVTAAASQETVSLFKQLERDQKSGLRVQQAMLPKSPASIHSLSFNHQLYPSMIMSGDFVDYFELFDGRVAFYIADVSGHGASSAFITVLLKSLSRRLLDDFHRFMSTAEILNWVNTELLQWKLEHHVTMFFGIIDQENGRLEYSNAAHFPGTILCHKQGTEFLEIGGQPLGLYEEPTYLTHRLELPDKYLIAMFSDGVFEILPEEALEDKEERLLKVVKFRGGEHGWTVGLTQGKIDESLVDGIIDDLGVLSANSIPDDIAVFTVTSSG